MTQRRLTRSLILLLCTAPWAFIIASRAEAAAWIGLVFAAIIVVPQLVLWHHETKQSGGTR